MEGPIHRHVEILDGGCLVCLGRGQRVRGSPGWTPIFMNASGVVLEVGGALQHGAIIAREYGLPCVTGIETATVAITDGQMIEVDGSNGIVRVLEEAT